MNEVMMLRRAEPRKILQTCIEKKIPAVMSYLSRGKWYVSKVLLTDLGFDRFNVEVGYALRRSRNNSSVVSPRKPRKKPRLLNMQLNLRLDQPVGISLKYGHDKFIFETTVVELEPVLEQTGVGTIITISLGIPNRIELVQRRSYFRVDVPESLKVNVMLWRRCRSDNNGDISAEHYRNGRLVDISAGGAQIIVDTAGGADLREGEFLKMRFTPMPYETPLMCDTLIKNVISTADDKNLCLGLQIVGLEVSHEGREVLSRLVGIVERYHQINQSSARQHDIQPTIDDN